MLSPLNTPLYTSGASLGRKYLYDLYNNPTKNDLLTNAVKKYFKDMKYFENSCELIEHGSPATYNFNAHSFVLVDMLIDSHTCENSDMAKARRDYVIHCIGNLANRLFSTNDPGMVAKTLCVKKYLTKKILKHGSFDCEKNYIEMGDPRLMSKGEKSLNKFLNKILENKLLSDEEKIQKRNQKGKSSNPYDNVIETPLISSEQASE